MSPLLAPLFAQLVSLQVGDRTEARYTTLVQKQLIGATAPSAALAASVGRANLLLAYSPLLMLVPLERRPRELYLFHTGTANASYRVGRTTLTLTNTVGYGTLNFQLITAQAPPAPTATNTGTPATGTPTTDTPSNTGTPTTGTPTTGTPTTGTPTTSGSVTRPDAVNRKVRYLTLTNALGLNHVVTRNWGFGAQAGTTLGRGLDARSRETYPELRGWFVGGNTNYVYRLDARDSFNSVLTLLKTWSSNDNEVATLSATETWAHQLGKRSSAALGAGLNVTRFSQADGLRGFSVFPTLNAGVTHQAVLGHDVLYVAANAYSAPVLDPLRALVDPRVGVGGQLGYTHKKLFLAATGAAAFSIAPTDSDTGAVNAAQAELRASYQLSKITQVDTGARVSYQTYQTTVNQRDTVVPLNWAAFVGLSFGYQVRLAGRQQQQ